MNPIRVFYRQYVPGRMHNMIPSRLRHMTRAAIVDPVQPAIGPEPDGTPAAAPKKAKKRRRMDRQSLAAMMVTDAQRATQDRIRTDPETPFEAKALWNVLKRSEYAYGMYHGAQLAARHGHQKVSVLEFGVAGGNGLMAMEAHARRVERMFPVKIEIYGFDTGEGLTPPRDHRDMPYKFAAGNYRMDVDRLRSALTRATLVLGDVKQTVSDFIEMYRPAPIGFVSMDLDYYSSTMDALQLFRGDIPDDYFLPRLFMNFDDTVGTEAQMYNHFTGELAAIDDFNAANEWVKIAGNRVFRRYAVNFEWYHQSFIMHRFRHRDYDTYISKASPDSLSLRK